MIERKIYSENPEKNNKRKTLINTKQKVNKQDNQKILPVPAGHKHSSGYVAFAFLENVYLRIGS